jgi:uncharacterized protein HemX
VVTGWLPWVLLAAALATGGAYWQGTRAGKAAAEADAAREERLVRETRQAAAEEAAKAIAGIRVRHTTIRQEVEREIQVRPEYRDCRHAPEQLQRINAALSGASASGAAGDGGVP